MMNTMTAAVIHAVCPPVIHMTVPRAAVRAARSTRFSRSDRGNRTYWKYGADRKYRCHSPTGTSVITNALSALNISAATVSVTSDGTNIPLPVQPYINGFTANASNTQFTVNQTGTYFISYVIKMTSGLPMSSRITRNDTPILNSYQYVLNIL